MLPKVTIDYVPNDMPQDILNQEEQKDQITSEQKLTVWMRSFTRALREKTEEISQDLDNLTSQRNNIIQMTKLMTKFNPIDS